MCNPEEDGYRFKKLNCFSIKEEGSMEKEKELYGTPNIAHTFSAEMTFEDWMDGFSSKEKKDF